MQLNALNLVRILVAITSLLSAGCVVTLPDGTQFLEGVSESTVRAKLGEPDLTDRSDRFHVGLIWMTPVRPEADLYYFERRCFLNFRSGGLQDVVPIQSEEMPDVMRRQRIYREAVPLANPGSTIAEVVSRLGEPEVAEELWNEKGSQFGRKMTYRQLSSKVPIPREVLCYFLTQDLLVWFDDGRVRKAEPIPLSVWRDNLHRDPKEYVRDADRPSRS